MVEVNSIGMTARGKNLNLFLIDGISAGRIKCTLANWTGIAYRIPRKYISRCKGISALKQSGVYFLFGGTSVYIGQAGVRKSGEGILTRLQEHDVRPKLDWDEAVIFTVSNNSFGPSEISYLENRFYGIASEVGRYQVINGNEPTQGNVTEEKESELEEFIEYAKLVMGVLWHPVFEPIARGPKNAHLQKSPKQPAKKQPLQGEKKQPGTTVIRDEKIYTITRGGTSARMRCTLDGYLLLKGSTLRENTRPSCPAGMRIKREACRGIISPGMSTMEDILFYSASSAAAFVLGSSANGLDEWKNESGVPLGRQISPDH